MNHSKYVLVLFTTLTLAACASKTEKKIDQELISKPRIQNRDELRDLATTQIETSPNLNAEQKSKLIQLRNETRVSLDQKVQESLQLRRLLIQEVLGPQYDSQKISVIKSKLQKTEKSRINILFQAVDQANTILGRDQELRRQYFENLLDGGSRSRS